MRYLALILLIGCNPAITRSQFGIGHSGPISDGLQPIGEYTANLVGGASVGSTHAISDHFNIDLLIGFGINQPLHKRDERGQIFSLEASPRLRYTGWQWQPYAGVFIGPAYTPKQWIEQGTYWGFNLGGDVGLRKKYGKYYFTFGYRLWHHSNGSAIFGSPGPNPGFNTDVIIIGVEW